MQVVVFGAHDAPRKRLALSYTSRRDHLRAECLPVCTENLIEAPAANL